MVAAKIANMGVGGDSANRPIGLFAQDDAAEMLNVSARSVKRAKKVQESGDENLIADVESGKVTVSAAAQHVAAVQRYSELSIIPTQKKGGDRGNQHTGGKASIDALPQSEVAEMLNVSRPSVQRATKIANMGEGRHSATASIDAVAQDITPPRGGLLFFRNFRKIPRHHHAPARRAS